MRRQMVFLVVLLTSCCGLNSSVLADETLPTVEFKTKLGVSRKVVVQTIQNPSIGFSSSRTKGPKSATEKENDSPPSPPSLTLSEKSGLSLHIPLKLVKTLKNSKEQTVVTLTDGSEYTGQISGNNLLVTDKNEDYTLSSIQNLKVLNPEIPEKADPKRESWNLFVPIPLEKKFTIHSPSFIQNRKTTFGGFKGGGKGGGAGPGANPIGAGPGGAGPGGGGGPGQAGVPAWQAGKPGGKYVSIAQGKFSVHLDGESVIGTFTDFDRIHLEKQGDNWKMTVQAPGAEPVTGILESDGWALSWETPGGYTIGISSQTGLNGFTLTKGTKAGGNAK